MVGIGTSLFSLLYHNSLWPRQVVLHFNTFSDGWPSPGISLPDLDLSFVVVSLSYPLFFMGSEEGGKSVRSEGLLVGWPIWKLPVSRSRGSFTLGNVMSRVVPFPSVPWLQFGCLVKSILWGLHVLGGLLWRDVSIGFSGGLRSGGKPEVGGVVVLDGTELDVVRDVIGHLSVEPQISWDLQTLYLRTGVSGQGVVHPTNP